MGDGKDKKFISERILGRNLTFGRALKFLLVSILCGVVFGAAAFAVYYFASQKTAEAEMERMQESLAESVRAVEAEKERLLESERAALEESEALQEETLPAETENEKEATPESAEAAEGAEPDDNAADSDIPEETESGALTEEQASEVWKIVSEERENYLYTTDDLGEILNTQQAACTDISRYIVRVSSYISETTWFESTVETERNYAGIIVSKDEEEILILTVDTVVQGSERLKATFFDGTERAAALKKTSDRDGWTVLTVSAESIPRGCSDQLEAAEYAAAEDLAAGIPVISAGAPMGAINSFGFGYVNYIGDVRSEMDGSSRSCYTEAPSVPKSGTFLMTQDGRLIGLGVENGEDGEASGSRFLLAENCSVLLENLKKGNDMAWLGITGTDTPAEKTGKKVPEGMYVTDVEENSPAFAAGLKRGDIIVKIGSREIGGLSDYCSFLRNLRPEETIKVTVKREALRSEYKELEMEMAAGIR